MMYRIMFPHSIYRFAGGQGRPAISLLQEAGLFWRRAGIWLPALWEPVPYLAKHGPAFFRRHALPQIQNGFCGTVPK